MYVCDLPMYSVLARNELKRPIEYDSIAFHGTRQAHVYSPPCTWVVAKQFQQKCSDASVLSKALVVTES